MDLINLCQHGGTLINHYQIKRTWLGLNLRMTSICFEVENKPLCCIKYSRYEKKPIWVAVQAILAKKISKPLSGENAGFKNIDLTTTLPG